MVATNITKKQRVSFQAALSSTGGRVKSSSWSSAIAGPHPFTTHRVSAGSSSVVQRLARSREEFGHVVHTRFLLIAGQRFRIEQDEGVVFLTHPSWSLVGSGETLQEAVRDLYAEGAELKDTMSRIAPSDFDANAAAFFNFLLRL